VSVSASTALLLGLWGQRAPPAAALARLRAALPAGHRVLWAGPEDACPEGATPIAVPRSGFGAVLAALHRARRTDEDMLLLAADGHWPDGLWPRLAAARSSAPDAVLSALDPALPALSPLPEEMNPVPAAALDAACWLLGEGTLFDCGSVSPGCSLWPPLRPAAPRLLVLDHLCVARPLPPRAGDRATPALDLLRHRLRRYPLAADRIEPPDDRPLLLHLLHGWGGGVHGFVRDLCRADREHRHLVLVARADPGAAHTADRLDLHADLDAPPVRSWPLTPAIDGSAIRHDGYRALLERLLARFGVDGVMVSSLIGHSLDALRTGLPTTVVCHDYYPAWPVLHCDFGDRGRRFDRAELAAAVARGALAPLPARDADHWWSLREDWLKALAEADARLVAPSDSVRRNLCRMLPALAERDWRVIPHGVEPLPRVEYAPPARPRPRILVLGRVSGGKGEALLAQVIPALTGQVDFHLLGCGQAGMRFFGQGGVDIELDYRRDDLPAHVARIRPDAALIAASVAESYSYTLSELWMLGVPVVATALGSLAERIEDDVSGLLVAPEAQAIVEQLGLLASEPSLLDPLRAMPPPVIRSTADMAADYRELLPARRRGSVTEVRPALDIDLDAAQLAARADQMDRALADAKARIDAQQAELERRARWGEDLGRLAERRTRWARSLQADLDRSHAARQELQREFDERTAWALALRAEGERLAALVAERQQQVERLEREMGALLSSRSWRWTAPLRGLTLRLRRLRDGLRFRAGHLVSLLSRARRSLRSRGLLGTLRRGRELLAQPPLPAPFAIEPDRRPFEPFAVPRAEAPEVSVIVPVYNHFAHTLACLRSLAEVEEPTPFEVLVVDDCSSDETPERLAEIEGITRIRNAQNLGFIGACNAGAEVARGEFLVFLNNDTVVTPGWLGALVRTFAQRSDCGLAGARLVYPDGRLQEAGGIVFADGSGWNFGRFQDPHHPRYGYLRESDYCSGAAIMVRADLFRELGGFDRRYAPAYYEDTDLAFKVRAAGLRVYYQPRATVVHFEGVSSGTDTGSGIKRHQVINQQTFVEVWREALATHPPAGSDPGLACEHRVRGRLLVIDATVPTPDQDSGSLRLVNLMRVVQDLGWKVTFLADNRQHLPGYTEALQDLGIEALHAPWVNDPVAFLADRGREFDAVMVCRHYVAAPWLPLLRRYAPQARILFDTVDLHYLREQRLAELEEDEALHRQALATRRQELAVMRQSDVTLVVSPVEKALLAQEAPGVEVAILSNVHEIRGCRKDFDARADLVFVGGYQHPPNVDAAIWMVRQILPLIRAELPEVVLHLVGSRAPAEVAALGETEGVRFHGYVEDLDPLMDGCRIAVAPLRYGAGVKGKINLSLAHGQPVVATTVAVEGMDLEDRREVLVADDPEDFAAAVVRLYRDRDLWRRLSAAGLANVERHFSFAAARTALARILPPR
jgi:GT2 family glycosyltransferase/glycosyltransferase involved in cell wall biosynthesis